ncbi:MAG: hypothetical protein IPH44_42655 [Myxococcales bacterium]|nr:hypothetical protein [Myxococcales bacterium]MBK7192902.1 hypothetical protein [Myxococcales bacterium]MBP6845498.1 hypothetical protein [Kofleriaceae bacterium]
MVTVMLGLALAACGSGRPRGEDGGAIGQVDAGPPPPRWTPAARADALAAGEAVITKHQCTRCHELDGRPGAGRPYDCVSCHVFLTSLTPTDPRYQKIAANNGQDVLDRYIRNIAHLRQVPSLTAIGRRLRPAWIAEFLQHPLDLRPALDDAMLRNTVTPDDARALARYFAAVADVPADGEPGSALTPAPTPDPDRVARGRAVFEQRGCPACHVVGNERFAGQTAASLAQNPLAPDLRFARARLGPETMVAWIMDPPAVWPAATMPKLGVSRADAELIRDYLAAPVALPPAPPVEPLLAMPPAATHRVSWDEVKERVLGKVCVHCHMNDHEKDVGPGNLGGLGYAGRGLAMRTYEMLVRGARGPDGKRYSVLQRQPGEAWPRILEVMVRRRVENLRDHVTPLADHDRPAYPAGALGMPMGLPTMTDEEIGLLRRWIEDGCPGPTRVTGRPGFTDGFLVPDGPIKPNRGCQLRAPAAKPPRWSTRPLEPAPATPP